MVKTLTLLMLTAIVMASVACGASARPVPPVQTSEYEESIGWNCEDIFIADYSDAFEAYTAESPLSDPLNLEGWLLRTDMSDEFNQGAFDTEKWHIAGSEEYDLHTSENCDGSASDWIGRAPSVFDISNVNVNNTHLILSNEWEPHSSYFPVIQDGEESIDDDCDCKYENYTTGGVITKSNMQYGYVEIRSKAAPVTVSSAFWLIGNHFEIDIFEMIGKEGNGTDGSGPDVMYMMPATLHNWDIGGLDENGYGEDYTLNWDVSSSFHVYGAHWSSESVIFFADGREIGSITKEEAGDIWNGDYLHLWIDNEMFVWEGVPNESELPAYFEIDYVRVWQKDDE
jgi:beta-glucanase (GH16 family)